MNVETKASLVNELAQKLKGARAVYLTDFAGLNVKAMTSLRAKLRSEGIEYLVVKNTLAERALEGLDLPDVAEYFRGPTGLAIATSDPVAPARVLVEFAKDHDNRPAVKAGIVERRALASADVERLAKLPSREQLLAMVAGSLEAPLQAFVGALEAKLVEMAGLLEALREQRAGPAEG
jgi:large subunit ribosomal protein L10